MLVNAGFTLLKEASEDGSVIAQRPNELPRPSTSAPASAAASAIRLPRRSTDPTKKAAKKAKDFEIRKLVKRLKGLRYVLISCYRRRLAHNVL